MFSAGDLVIYGGSGVCRVSDVGPIKIGDKKRDAYYTLVPVFGVGTIYIPVDADVYMRPVLSREEAEKLIDQIPYISGEACTDRKPSALKAHYADSIKSNDNVRLVQVIKEIYAKERLAEQNKKRLGQIDQHYMKQAENMLYGELAIALDLPREEILTYIRDRIESPSADIK